MGIQCSQQSQKGIWRHANKFSELSAADEPGWSYPQFLKIVNGPPDYYLKSFQDYLKSLGFPPSFFGATRWEDVSAIGKGTAIISSASPETRHLFYWTMHYFPQSSSKGTAMV